MYEVRTNKTTWQDIVSYRIWTLDSNFIKFLFEDGKELILPKSEVLAIYQKHKTP